MRVALLDHSCRHGVMEAAASLVAVGIAPSLLTARPPQEQPEGVEVVALRELADAPLRLRKIGDQLSHVPAAWLALGRGRFEVAHAFTPSDALAAIAWARWARKPTVLTCMEPPRREQLAARRLRLQTWRRAVEQTDAVLAADEEVGRALRRWMAVEAPVVDPVEAEAQSAVYRRLLARRQVK